MTTREDLKAKGFEGLNPNDILWMGYNSDTEEVVLLNSAGIARTYKFKRIL